MRILAESDVKVLIKPRKTSSHKGDHGHALIIAGSKGLMGAAVIAARACIRAGAGLLTVNVPQDERFILQISIPEAMLVMRENVTFDLSKFSALGIGAGIGKTVSSGEILKLIIANFKRPMVFDADALNTLALDNKLFNKIPEGTILTPHPIEFDRLFGIHNNADERRDTAMKKAAEHSVVIVLKDHISLITFAGEAFYNTTGNAGLAKGGSGDALMGIITSFLAQGYDPFTAAKLGVYIHGLAADIALEEQSMESMLITDVIECLGKAFKLLL